MALFKCKMCGGDLEINGNANVTECDYCGVRQTVPSGDSEKKINLFNRANRLRISGQFDKAANLYESVIAEFPEEAEAYWGLCLCNYGIEYVDDPATGKKIPTCHRASFDSLLRDENFNLALEYSDIVARKLYIDQAKEIDRIMADILAVSRNEKSYDVFICYKETDEYGQRTIDSVLAQDIYDRLTEKGLNVFFARITLEDKLGRQYEPYIFAALNSAKVMLSIGTKYEYFHAVWVENEWSRFLRLMAKDRSKVLIPCYKDMSPEDMPSQFRALQAQDMSKIGFMQDLTRGIMKIVVEEKHVQVQPPAPQYAPQPAPQPMAQPMPVPVPQNVPQPMPRQMHQPVPQNVYQPVPHQVQYVGKKGPNVAIYLIICFFFGSFGMHSFYAKKIKKGLIQLLLCGTGISTFWAIIDFFRALFTRRVR